MVASDGPATPHDSRAGLTLWSFPVGRLIKRIGFPPWAISRDWKYYASDRDVIDVETEAAVLSLTKGEGVLALPVFSNNSRYIAFSTRPSQPDARRIRVLRIGEGSVVNEFGRRAVFSLAFHPNNETLASGHWDNVTLWNAVTGERIALLRGFGRYVQGIGFSADGRLLAAGTDAGGLQIWNVPKRRRLISVHIGGGQVSDPAFSPDGRLVAVGIYGTGTVWVIAVHSGKIVGKARVSDMGCGAVAFSPNGRYLIAPSTGGLITWPYDQGGTIRVFDVERRERSVRRSRAPNKALQPTRAAKPFEQQEPFESGPRG